MFEALAKSNINIRAIAQGSSEYNITTIIDQRDAGGRAMLAPGHGPQARPPAPAAGV